MHNNEETRNATNNYNMMMFMKLALLAFCVMFFKYYNGSNFKEELDAVNITAGLSQADHDEQSKVKSKSVPFKPKDRTVHKQPACPKEDKFLMLEGIRLDLELRRTRCKPEDVHNPAKHKIPKYYFHAKNTSNNEAQDTFVVNYLIGALLVTSLGAALLELYRAKTAQNQPPDGDKKGLRAPPNRKCSLADLTVLKHHRKELVRRESVMEQAREEAREELKLKQGCKPFPLLRRCSVPVGLQSIPEPLGTFSRRTSVVDANIGLGRKLSIVTDVHGMPMTPSEALLRRSSIMLEDAERKHHSRLVHRH